MRRRHGFAILAASLLLWWGLPGMVRAQGMNMGGMTMPSGMGQLAGPTGQLAGTGSTSGASAAPDVSLNVNDTYVSFIDSAVPHNVLSLRFDAAYDNRQPMRATYLFPKGVFPNTVGFPLPETRVDTLDLTSYAEYSIASWFSLFIEAPYRWINPEVNANQSGVGDMRYGMKLCTWSNNSFIATILFRVYQPSASQPTLGTGHWSLEPGLLAAYRITPSWHLEGELRYWIPLGGSDFSGDILRYGVGLSYGQRQASGFWYAPVVEAIGWTVLGGQTMVASSADSYIIQDARNQTIVNAYVGMRFGYAQNVDLYVGYGRSLTGDFWARDNYRIEMRFSY